MIRSREQTDFPHWLRREIETRLLTQREFARAAGVHFNAANAWLAGRSTPCAINVVRIANALGIDREQVESHLPQRRSFAAA